MLERIRIVLIGTSHPGNIGGVARAMHNMGLADLALVAPRCEVITQDSISRASGADHLLHQAKVHASLEDAVADCTLAVGASARSRTLPWPMISPRELAERLPSECQPDSARVALVFGREDSGLTNAELQRCHAHVHIPTNADFSSLNLAAAVQVIAYECRMAWLTQQDSASTAEEPDDALATHAELERYFEHLERTLIAIEFHDPAQPRQLMARLRRLYLRARPEKMEMNILRGILSATEKATDKHRP
ncbi:MAG TPA: tRNA (cytosine(32)/uridine(32)-2'-O)-methyltransferase TrmJ [Halomonas campaniensis]|uniref:tRNA (cytidine/uridine-2'-O-)-methyltransferase TrmJ n=1 Tax=Halomonas campaniensis TaxID=213554 RepID=A0A3D0KL17_9GAMM|nr:MULTISPECIES: tRNA (cytosine(32)/uridine(32)-2'-O)-methyltransferase TrmJ [unclassified Halomonas]HBS83772.1 tRNA (cytosine(32)/uridine(32)-2'-O)-methyltransferase TrmJ [Halomonas campaniensis]HCA04203.1 tRNA (cytosine(32)/uridine(32)-2'-O)-methyltransferase TrmJ [Halomonas campaniensis]